MYTYKRLQLPLDIQSVQIYPTFTINPYKGFLSRGEDPKNCMIAVGAEFNSIPIGLGIMVKEPQDRTVRLVSLYIAKEHRHKGVGSAILDMLERELLKETESLYNQIMTRVPSSPTSQWFEKMLLKRNWIIEGEIIGGKIPHDAKMDWVHKKWQIPKDFEIFKWKDLTEEERNYIQEKGKNENWYPSNLSPFWDEATIEYFNSLGLRYRGGRVVGWIMTHRIMPDTILYTPLFVDPTLKSASLGLILLAESMRMHLALPYPPIIYGAFFFRQSRLDVNRQWVNFFQKKLAPYCNSFLQFKDVVKYLNK